MSLKQDIIPYIDTNGLVGPAKGQGSNNGVMYSSEFIIMLIRNGEAAPSDIDHYIERISACMKTPGLLMRSPQNAGGQEGPDDYYGLAAAIDEINSKNLEPAAMYLAYSTCLYAINHLGCLNNEFPNTFQWSSFLVRQPQLDAVMLWAAGLPVGPILRLYTAISILFAAKGLPINDTDPRRLSWLVVQVASRHSWICRMAAKVWYRRLHKDYPDGMKGVAALYYESGHPFSKYWID